MKEITPVAYEPPKKDLLSIIEETREMKTVTVDGEKVLDETSFTKLNERATVTALRESFPLATSGKLNAPYVYNSKKGIWEELPSKESAQQMVEAHIVSQCKMLLAQLNGSSTISNQLNKSIQTVAQQYVRIDSSNTGHDLLRMTNPNLIAFRNGLYDFKTNTMRSITKDDYQTMALPYDLIEATEEDEDVKYWIEFIELLTGESKDLIIAYIGFLFYRSQRTIQTIMIFINGQTSNGRNGKGKLIELMRELLGDNTENSNYTALSIGDLADSSKDFVKVNLVNKMANFDADSDSKFLASTNVLKTLSTNDPLTVNVKHGSFVTFENYARLVVATNKLPNYRDSSSGFSDRLVIVPFIRYFGLDGDDFNNYIAPGKKFSDEEKQKHLDNGGMGKFAYYCIQQFRAMMKNGLSANPFRDMMTEEALKILENYQYNNDPIKQFLNLHDYEITNKEYDYVVRDGMYDLFKMDNSDSKMSERGFFEELETRGALLRTESKKPYRKKINGVTQTIIKGIKKRDMSNEEYEESIETDNIF